MRGLIMAVALLVIFMFTGSPGFAVEIPEWYKPVDGKPGVLHSDVPRYPGFEWSAPRLVRSKYEEGLFNFIGTNRVKGVEPYDVADYYEGILTKRGWTTQGPAGGSSSLMLIFKKGGNEVRVASHCTKHGGTDEPEDPRGTVIQIFYR